MRRRVFHYFTLTRMKRASRMKTRKSIHCFLNAEDGTTAVEYSVLLAMMLVAIIFGVTSTGGGVSAKWSIIKTNMESRKPEPALVLPARKNDSSRTLTEPTQFPERRVHRWSRVEFK